MTRHEPSACGGSILSDARSLDLLELAWPAIASSRRWSRTELAIAKQLVRGHSEKVIAARLDRSVHTIHAHIRRMYQKDRVNSRAELIAVILWTCLEMVQRGVLPAAASAGLP